MKIKKAKRKTKNSLDDLVQSIGKIIKTSEDLVRQAEAQYALELADIIESEDRNPSRIEYLLDYMLGFCFDDGVLALYKKLCRYYYRMDPAATASYVYAYRDMWDEGGRK